MQVNLDEVSQDQIINYVANMFRGQKIPRSVSRDWRLCLEIAIHDLQQAEFRHNDSSY